MIQFKMTAHTNAERRIMILLAATQVYQENGEFFLTEALREVNRRAKVKANVDPHERDTWSHDLQERGLIEHAPKYGRMRLTATGKIALASFTG